MTVGTFDGVHAGHRSLLSRVAEVARGSAGVATSVAITFREQPRAFLQPDSPATYLCTLTERLRLIRESGIDLVIPIDFDETLRSLSPRSFMTMLREHLGMSDFVSGPGAAIGRDREGDAHRLKALAGDMGFRLHVVPPACYQGAAVSSTAVRDALAAGQMASVAAMLGRNFHLCGRVERGDGRGRGLGFPTANIATGEPNMPAALPGDGIYATRAHLGDGESYPAATSIGVRPTFGSGDRTVEAYLIDFQGELYGTRITLEFVTRLRGEEKFDTVSELVAQIARDVDRVRDELGAAAPATPQQSSL